MSLRTMDGKAFEAHPVPECEAGECPMRVPPFATGPAENGTDFCMRRKGARQLARAIEAAWADSGYQVHCRVDPVRSNDGRIICYTVKSNLRNGLPR